MAEESVFLFKSLEILIKWKSGELLEHEELYGLARASHEEFCEYGRRPLKRSRRPPGWGQPRFQPSLERRTGGTDGLEESLQSLILKRLREKVVNLDDLAEVLEVCKLELNAQLKSAEEMEIFRRLVPQIRQTISNVSSELLQMRKRNPRMRLKEFKVYFDPVCWSSLKRVRFFCCLSNTISEPPKHRGLPKPLETEWRLHFKGNWIDKIDQDLIDIIDPKHRRPHCPSVVSLLRFVRNRWHHQEEFRNFCGTCNPKVFYDYFNERFPDLLKVSFGVALCFRQESWFEEFLPIETS